MLAQLNNPFFFLITLPPLVLFGGFFLLRWALNGAASEERASVSMILAIMLSTLLIMGQPKWPIPYGISALFYALLVWGGFGLLQTFWPLPCWLQRTIDSAACIIVSVLIAFPLISPNMFEVKNLWVVLLLGICLIMTLRTGWEMQTFEDRISPFMVLGMTGATLSIIAFLAEMSQIFQLTLSLSILCLLSAVWGAFRRGGQFSIIATTSLAISLAITGWSMWAQYDIPLLCIITLPFIVFAKSVTIHTLQALPSWALRFYYPLLFVMAALPGLITLVSFDVFKAS